MLNVFSLVLCVVCADPCSREWIVMEPVGGSFFPREMWSDVKMDEDRVVLRNRGTILSKQSFPSGVSIECDWKWTQGDEASKNHDHLVIALATDGRQRSWSHEIYDGIIVRFNPTARSVALERLVDGRDDGVFMTTAKNIELKRDSPYRIRINDNGRAIAVFLNDAEVLSADIADRSAARVAIYNREPVSGVVKESVLSGLTIGVAR